MSTTIDTDDIEEAQDFSFPPLYSLQVGGKFLLWVVSSRFYRGSRIIQTVYGEEGGKLQTSEREVEPRGNRSMLEQTLLMMRRSYLRKMERAPYYTPHRGSSLHPKMMKAYDFDPERTRLEFPVAYQPKVDGIRTCAFIENSEVMIRTYHGKHKSNLHHLYSQLRTLLAFLPPQTEMIDGELLHVDGRPLNELVSIFNTKEDHPEIKKLYLAVFDIFIPEWNYGQRLETLRRAFAEFRRQIPSRKRHLRSLPTYIANDIDELHAEYSFMLAHRYRNTHIEGIMIKKLDKPYVSGRRANILKWKDVMDSEFEIVGHSIAAGNQHGAVIFHLVTDDGKTFKAVPSMPLSVRREMALHAEEYYGKQATVEYYNLTVNGIPSHATLKCIRDYE